MIHLLLQDVRYAVRQVRRAPGLAVAVVATLAVAIGAATALFSLLNAVVLRRLPVHDPDRLVVLSLTDQRGQATRLILLGVALGVPCALAAGRLTGALVYGVDPSDPRALVAAATLFVVIGATAALLPVRRVSNIDPMTALRCE